LVVIYPQIKAPAAQHAVSKYSQTFKTFHVKLLQSFCLIKEIFLIMFLTFFGPIMTHTETI